MSEILSGGVDQHDATADFAVTAPRHGWQLAAVDPVEVLLHGDFAPTTAF